MRSRRRAGAAAIVAALAVCAGSSLALAQVTFTDVTASAFPGGLGVSHFAWGDCDGDGDDDLLLSPATVWLNGGPPGWTFTRKADVGDLAAGPHGIAQWFDLDNDGDLDVFGVGWDDAERVYVNDGSCRFTAAPGAYGDAGNSVTVAPGDYDADGYLDVFVGNYERHCGGTPTVCADCTLDRLWRNRRDGTFENVYATLGMEATERSSVYGAGHCVVETGRACTKDADCKPYPQDACKVGLCARASQWVDYNNDGWLDLYAANYRLDPNLLWENDGAGGFREVTLAKNYDGEQSNGAWGHTLGVDWADFDNDGDMDVFVADLAHGIYYLALGHDISLLYANAGAPGYAGSDWRPSSGMKPYDPYAQPDWCETSPAWADYDNDGSLDIYVTHIYTSSARNTSTLYRQDPANPRRFLDRTAAHGASLGTFENYAAVWCDYDQDGDLDLLTEGAPAIGQPRAARLLRNDGGNARPFIAVVLAGKGAGGTNREGIGARVTVTDGVVSQVREISGNLGYHVGRGGRAAHVGLGDAPNAAVDRLDVRWTTRQTETFTNVPSGIRYTVHEGATIRRGTAPQAPAPIAGGLFPFHDPVLRDGVTYFYLVDGAAGDLRVRRDDARGTVVLGLD